MQKIGRRRPLPKTTNNRRSTHNRFFLKQFLVGVFLLFVLSLLGVAVWYGTRLESLSLTSVKVEGGETISHETVQKLAENELLGEYYRFVPKRFVWFYPESVILAKVKEMPRVKDVTIEKKGQNTILISISEYYPFALWCGQGGNVDASGCTFLDSDGYAFVEAPPLSGSAMIRYFDPSLIPKAGEKPFNAGFMSATSRFVYLIGKDFGFGVSHIEKTGEEEVLYHLFGGGQLKVSLHQPIDDTFENLSTILRSEEFNHLRPDNFQYIDLRFGNKVFVNEDTPGSATSTATSTEESL